MCSKKFKNRRNSHTIVYRSAPCSCTQRTLEYLGYSLFLYVTLECLLWVLATNIRKYWNVIQFFSTSPLKTFRCITSACLWNNGVLKTKATYEDIRLGDKYVKIVEQQAGTGDDRTLPSSYGLYYIVFYL